jgi:hypothetical protein
MHSIFRTYLALSLALMLALTGQSMAVARGATDAAGQMVLCTGTGPVTIFVDENGEPTSAPHICPDCALHLLAAVVIDQAGPVRIDTQGQLHFVRHDLQNRHHIAPSGTARGPPVSA